MDDSGFAVVKIIIFVVIALIAMAARAGKKKEVEAANAKRRKDVEDKLVAAVEKQKAAVSELEAQADSGDADANLALGLRKLSNGDVAQGVERLERAAQGDSDASANAMLILGSLYSDGTIVDQDVKKGVDYYQRAAKLGQASAAFQLFKCLRDGLGVERDEAKALEWLRVAAEKGNDDAQLELANRLRDGGDPASETAATDAATETPTQPQDRIDLLRAAAEKGNLDATRALVEALEEKNSIENKPEIERWRRQAADLGDPDAMLKLGELLVAKNNSWRTLVEGAKLLRRAAIMKAPCSSRALDSLRALPHDVKLEACFGNEKFLKKLESEMLQ